MRTECCRLCCENEGNIHIFNNSDELKPSTKIMYCCNKSKVNVEEDDALPKFICSACYNQLSQTYKFILQCEAADQKLRLLELKRDDNSEDDQYLNTTYEFKLELKSDYERSSTPLLYSPECSSVLENNKSLDNKESCPVKANSPILNNKKPVLKRKECSIKQKTKKKQRKINTKQGPIHCPSCGRTCLTKSALLAHMRSHSDKRPFKCSLCEKTYKDPAGLKRHTETNHTESRTRDFVCENCGKLFFYKKYLTIHMRIHTGETPYACKLCPARFTQSGSLSRHKRWHTGEKPFSCSSCSKKFSSKAELTKHAKAHIQGKNYSCVICNLKFKHSYTLKIHMKHHENKSMYICDLCGKILTQKNNLALHISRRHSAQSGFCNICSKYASNIEMHMWKHNNYRGLQCDHCSSSFFDKKGLIRHINHRHKDYKYKCTENGCEAMFPVKHMLNYHVTKYHTSIKAFPCDLCSRAFYRKSDYVRHKLGTHKEKPN